MHLLAATPGTVDDGSEAVDLGQSPGEVVIVTAAETELACLAAAHDRLGSEAPDLRLANMLQLGHNLSVDLYVERVISQAKLVILRVLGGERYWPYGVEQVAVSCRAKGIALAALPGDDKPDAELRRHSTLPEEACERLWRYFIHGGVDNTAEMLRYIAGLLGRPREWREPAPLMRAGLYWPGLAQPGLEDLRAQWIPERPVAALVFYRALLQAGNLRVIDSLIETLAAQGVNALPIATASLKEDVAAAIVRQLIADAQPDVVINGTAFAVSKPGAERAETPFDVVDAPVLQAVFAGGTEEQWRTGMNGLSARDIAMNVALPEVDGRILARAVSFKGDARWHDATQCWITEYSPVPDRVAFVAELAARWIRLRRTAPFERRVAIVLANYPNRNGRLANGVGLDTPAGVANAVERMAADGYAVQGAPRDGRSLMELLTKGPTNANGGRDPGGGVTLSLTAYRAFFATLPEAVRARVSERWGAPEADPFVQGDTFVLPAHRFGNLTIAIQPARGYNIDPTETYHDPDLPPPHGYMAFYAWLRGAGDEAFDAHAVVHFGKHGNLEWLPGKALALSAGCFPEAALGPLPQVYPFIVNDPGEGSQAKRRTAAVVVDHLTPPLSRAETYGPLRELEMLVDEYYEAAGLDPRRLPTLRERILSLTSVTGLDKDCGIAPDEDTQSALQKLDNHLCELKESQIRDGLHIFGESPADGQRTDLLVALARVPRGAGSSGDASLIRTLAADLDLGPDFDPLDTEMAAPWNGPRPDALNCIDEPWRTAGDTVERLEVMAAHLISGRIEAPGTWTGTCAVLETVKATIAPRLDTCGNAEMGGLLRALDGRFLEPGPSGAPTRGRPDVLPTGRNFYSVDSRAVPTPTAWHLGWKSAQRVIERHAQEHGDYPRRIALSAWGTANMRTGGDDIAQALALMGVQPTWDTGSGRVNGFEIMPASVLDRPRVDVTLRVSGFFRDAFPHQIDLVDSAARAVAKLDEPPEVNPLAARYSEDRAALIAAGADGEEAGRRAGHRVFGAKPGAYGAGLQALIDEKAWSGDSDFAEAFLAWGGYAYGGGAEGTAERELLEARLGGVEAVLHNQDNREHDILDSDDYYQFEGGLAATVRSLSGRQPAIYHSDHSRPESPRVRTLSEEIARVVRARAVNPKWIAGVMRHGYKGAFEMAATVDYLFAFAATTHCVGNHHFDAVFDAYLADDSVRAFIADANPAALAEMSDRLLEAVDRGLWQPRSNMAHDLLATCAGQHAGEDTQ
jgi:cobaltochelatase CobN